VYGCGVNWPQFFQQQGKLVAQVEQARQDLAKVQAKLDAMARAQAESQLQTQVLVASAKGAYKTIAVTATIVGAVATLAARWWVATHSGR
jgi:hypothetical protein